jgi:hypothetical protein
MFRKCGFRRYTPGGRSRAGFEQLEMRPLPWWACVIAERIAIERQRVGFARIRHEEGPHARRALLKSSAR